MIIRYSDYLIRESNLNQFARRVRFFYPDVEVETELDDNVGISV